MHGYDVVGFARGGLISNSGEYIPAMLHRESLWYGKLPSGIENLKAINEGRPLHKLTQEEKEDIENSFPSEETAKEVFASDLIRSGVPDKNGDVWFDEQQVNDIRKWALSSLHDIWSREYFSTSGNAVPLKELESLESYDS